MELYEVTIDYVNYLRKFEPKKYYQMQMIKTNENFQVLSYKKMVISMSFH